MTDSIMTVSVLAGVCAVAAMVAAGFPGRVEFHWSCPFIWFPPRWLTRRVWFRTHAPRRVVHGWHFKLWNLFGSSAGGYWGIGLMQVGKRHLLAAINNDDNPQTVVWVCFWRIR